MHIAKVVVDIALDREFDYLVPPSLRDKVQIGSLVLVPFGPTKKHGFVLGLANTTNHKAQLKEIAAVVGSRPFINEKILQLARWMAEYYLAPIEQSLRAILPSVVRRRGVAFKKNIVVTPTEKARDAQQLATLRDNSPRQADILEIVLSSGEIPLRDLLESASTTSATVRRMEKDGYLVVGEQVVARNPFANCDILPTTPLKLTSEQEEAFKLITKSIDTRQPPVVLLYGVTGSGKTEVYLQALAYARGQGKGAIILVPEIALTPQTVECFRGRFGDEIAVLHSHLSEGERHDEWHRIAEGKAQIVIGARSALFAPVSNLGLIVVDEEHEQSYKQDEAPRYNARDVAVIRGHMEQCSVILGSATPSLETYRNVTKGKYAMARLTKRVDHRKMPAVRVVDMRVEAEKAGGLYALSRDLAEAISLRLNRSEQTILFINRRGYSSSLVCPKCGYVATCTECSVSMTYHRVSEELRCHICGARKPVPSRCPNKECNDPKFRYAGLGTQRVENIVERMFPQARITRIDSDVTVRKDAYTRILGDFRAGKIDILIGTQMIAKGLHFPNVTLVGVISADIALHMPDFRAGERTFQLLTQVAGRAGRGDVAGEVIIQTFTPFHPAIQAARRLDFDGFADQELQFREELNYPPFVKIISATIKGSDEGLVAQASQSFGAKLRAVLPESAVISDAVPAPLAKAKGVFRYQIIIRSPTAAAVVKPLKTILSDTSWPRQVTCSIDVGALSLI